jgi:hypothetical protein
VKYCDRDGVTLIDSDALTTPSITLPDKDPLATSPITTVPMTDPIYTKLGARRSGKLRWIIIASALFIIAAVSTAGYFRLRDYLQSRVSVSLQGMTLSSGGERSSLFGRVVDLAKVAVGGSDLLAHVKINNSTAFSGALESATYTVMAGDKELGRGVWIPGDPPVQFNAGEGFDLDLPFRLDSRNTVAGLLDAVSGQPIPVELRGEMGVRVFAITFTIPFRARLVTPQLRQ